MKIRSTITIISAALLPAFFAACGGGDTGASVTPPPAESGSAAKPADSSNSITITGNDQMKFDKTEFRVKAGEEISITFKNVGKLPKEAMGHNVAVLKKGIDPIPFANASASAEDNEHIAPDREGDVIAATKILGPGESETITFTLPEKGDYPFLCSFPGHAAAGMRGTLKAE